MKNKQLKIYNKKRDFILPAIRLFGFGLMLAGAVTIAIGSPIVAVCEFVVGFAGAGYAMLEEYKDKKNQVEKEKVAFIEAAADDYISELEENKLSQKEMATETKNDYKNINELEK